MRHEKAAPILAGIMILALGSAACSSGGSNDSNATEPPTTTAVAAPASVYGWGVPEWGVTKGGQAAGLLNDTPTALSGIPGTVAQIATSNSDTYALTSAGTVWAWGAGQRGELGDGTTVSYVRSFVQVRFPTGVTIAALPNPMPFDTGMAIDSQGNVWGWGYDHHQELCLPASANALLPVKLPLTDVTLATGAGAHALYDSGGKVVACGFNTDGELGDGTTTERARPTPVVGLPKGPVKAFVSSWQGSGALMADGTYYDWGYGADGQLGDGRTTNSLLPVRVALPAPVISVSQGGSDGENGQTLAILSNGAVWSWGDNQWGQLGNDTDTNSPSPVPVVVPSGVRFTRVCSGGSTAYAIDSTGALWAWGQNNVGQLGLAGANAQQLKPLSIGISLTQISSTASNVAGSSRP
jgi:alpha-tubulin suppressor-like RCC1 family protein